ncbi:hypothetical protein [Bradyrhizobium valentinum]|uniref:Uncharacterized protein n=1 Tax=Bradyrhizobium valentinum TaxID=1518501 RepID=A0A0R3KNN9_9BRAD|nr:hypothetical protein [Bradyrhizobium valentinum]KRQ97207.1 hypothetical protein CQ10_05075 [Bradyrhizobium valentinum]KRR05258.1 hypothetical protein CP49_01410 [Bradyrhizobium valentinum]
MQEPLPVSGRLPTQLKVKYGPVDLLGRFFLWADTAARDRGVTLFFASLKDLIEANRGNSDSWRPLVPAFDEALGGVTPEAAFVLIGRNKDGEVVATQAARIYDWPETSLKDEATSLRMFYADPDAAFARGDRCEITAPIAEKITGRVVFSGGIWYRRDFRGKDLGTILPRISRAYAFTRWNSDFTTGMLGDGVIAGGLAERAGYTKIELGCIKLVASPLGEMRCGLAWMQTDELLADLAAIMDRANVPVIGPRIAEEANH